MVRAAEPAPGLAAALVRAEAEIPALARAVVGAGEAVLEC